MTARGIDKAICAIKATLAKHGGITKERKAPMGYSFRGIEDLDEVMCGLTAANGVNVYPRILSKDIRHTTTNKGAYQSHVIVEVEWTFVSAEDGSERVASTVGEAMDTQDKAFNKAMQAARKYADIMVFRIPTSGDDTESYDERPTAPTPPARSGSPRQGAQVQPPSNQGSPPAPARTPEAGTISVPQAMATIVDETFKRVGEVNSIAVLTAFAEEVSTFAEPGRSELLRAVEARACLLFAEAKSLDDVKAGYSLSENMGGEVQKACNKAYARLRKNSHGAGAAS